jgi:hypothetical protein
MGVLLVPAVVVVIGLLVYLYGVDSRLDEHGSLTYRPS